MTYTEIRCDIEDPVATITLNRPKVLNAWTPTMDVELRTAISAAAADPRVVGIVITGAGRGFCSGADTSLLGAVAKSGVARRSSDPWEQADGEFDGRFSYLMAVDKPVIAAINGVVAGMGVALALCCDLRVVTPEAYFTTAFARRGLIAEWGVEWILPRLVGSATALDLLFSGRRVEGSEAQQIGLANTLVPSTELLPNCRAYIENLAKECSPASMALIKRQVYSELHAGVGQAERHWYPVIDECVRSDDFHEGIAAYLERRRPRFSRIGVAPVSEVARP